MKQIYLASLAFLGIGFAAYFFITFGPLLAENPSIVDAFNAGYANPYSSGFSTDVITCWFVLAVWVIYERFEKGIKYGWVVLLLGLIPGVATAFALYLFLRMRQLEAASLNA